MKLHVNFIRSSNGKRDIACYVYVPDGAVRGIVQIAHGMCDYIENYALLAEHLCEKGIVVCGNDHLGHGNSAEDSRDYGYFGGGGYQTLVKDLRKMNKLVRTTYKDVPLVLVGHSMGSFLARAYAVTFPETIDGAVFLGTAGSHNPVRAAQMLAATIAKTRGNHYRSRLLYDLAFKGYNSKYPEEGEYAWLSRDRAVGEKFAADPQRNFIFTADGYYGAGGGFKACLCRELPERTADADRRGQHGPRRQLRKRPRGGLRKAVRRRCRAGFAEALRRCAARTA